MTNLMAPTLFLGERVNDTLLTVIKIPTECFARKKVRLYSRRALTAVDEEEGNNCLHLLAPVATGAQTLVPILAFVPTEWAAQLLAKPHTPYEAGVVIEQKVASFSEKKTGRCSNLL